MKLIFALLLTTLIGCKPSQSTSGKESAKATAATSASAPQTSAAPSGSVGTVRGVVRIVGDDSPPMPKSNQIPVGKCFTAHKMHGKVFRKGPNGEIADVLVAVTEYASPVSLPKAPVEVELKDCAISQRTIVMAPGQELHAKNVGIVPAIPHLKGAPQAALVVAVPGGEPIKLTPINPGRYLLVDESHDYATADVFVLNFPTADVTDELGTFEIKGIPTGKVKLSALLPDAGVTVEQQVVVEANKTTEVALELRFDRAKWQATLEHALSTDERSQVQ
jgi:hypothetical protein